MPHTSRDPQTDRLSVSSTLVKKKKNIPAFPTFFDIVVSRLKLDMQTRFLVLQVAMQ
jgi:hypothetical protein